MLNKLNRVTDADMLYNRLTSMRNYTYWNSLISRFIIILKKKLEGKLLAKKPYKK